MEYFRVFANDSLSNPIKVLKPDKVVAAGTEYRQDIWIQNFSGNELADIILYSDDKDVSFEPKLILSMKDMEVVKVVVVWKPPVDREKPLSTKVLADFNVIRRA